MSTAMWFITGIIAFLIVGWDGKKDAEKDGRTVGIGRGAVERTSRLVPASVRERARERALEARDRRRERRVAAKQGTVPFGRPAKGMPTYTARNPSGVEQFLPVASESVLQRIGRKLRLTGPDGVFSTRAGGIHVVDRTPAAKSEPPDPAGPEAAPPAQDGPAETSQPASAPETPAPADRGDEPVLPRFTSIEDLNRARQVDEARHIAQTARLTDQAAIEAADKAFDLYWSRAERQTKAYVNDQQAAHTEPSNPEPGRDSTTSEPARPASGEETIDRDAPQPEAPEGNPMNPRYTCKLDLLRAEGLIRTQLEAAIQDIMNDTDIDMVQGAATIKQLREEHNAYWDQRRAELNTHLSSPEGMRHCADCGHRLDSPSADCHYQCSRCGCKDAVSAKESPGEAEPNGTPAASATGDAAGRPAGAGSASAASQAVATPVDPTPAMDAMDSIANFASAPVERMPIPALIISLDETGQGYAQLAQMLRAIAQRLDEEALLDQKIIEGYLASAMNGDLAGTNMRNASTLAGTLYRQWIDATHSGGRVPAQGVLNATSS